MANKISEDTTWTLRKNPTLIEAGAVVASSVVYNSCFCREVTAYWLGGNLYAVITNDSNNDKSPFGLPVNVYADKSSALREVQDNFGLGQKLQHQSNGVAYATQWIA